MEAINTIELSNPEIYPSDDLLKTILGKSYNSYCELINLFNKNNMTIEWRYYKDGKAWLCKVQLKKEQLYGCPRVKDI